MGQRRKGFDDRAASFFHERIHGASVPHFGSRDPEFARRRNQSTEPRSSHSIEHNSDQSAVRPASRGKWHAYHDNELEGHVLMRWLVWLLLPLPSPAQVQSQ